MTEEPTPEPTEEADTSPEPEADPTATDEPTPTPSPIGDPEPAPLPSPAPTEPDADNPDAPEPAVETEDQPAPPDVDQPDPEDVVIANISPSTGLASTADQTVEINGQNLHKVSDWTLDDEAVLVNYATKERAYFNVPLSTYPKDAEVTLLLAGKVESDTPTTTPQEVGAEFEIKPFLDSEGNPITDQVFGQEVEATPNPLRVPSTPPVHS
jgi:hypothetical protein